MYNKNFGVFVILMVTVTVGAHTNLRFTSAMDQIKYK